MSIYDKASLVLIPSGTKTSKVFSQKPVNGDGDFTFSRSTAATRVNADGNIEKETSNRILQSNTFNTSPWAGNNSGVTGGQSGYDGTNDAWQQNATGAYSYRGQSLSSNGVQTFSVYAKEGSVPCMRLYTTGSASLRANFDLSNGSVIDHQGIEATIESAGNGYYRCSLTFNANSTFIYIYAARAGGNIATTTTGDNIYIQDAQLEQGLVARDYIETTTAAVEGGITDNVPRLDYTDSSCPSLKLEPQRSNGIAYSEYFDSYWDADNQYDNITITHNATASPEGLQNATKLVGNSTSNNPSTAYIGKAGAVSSQPYVSSVFAKAGEYDYIVLTIGSYTSGFWASFNLDTGEVDTDPTASNTTASIEDYGDGWYRCMIHTTNTGGAEGVYFSPSVDGTRTTNYTNTTNGVYIFGAQVEAGSYATSYIPTYGTSVTRNGDLSTQVENFTDLPTSYPFAIYSEPYLTNAIGNGAWAFYENSHQYSYYSLRITSQGKFNMLSRPQGVTQNEVNSTSTYSEGFHKVLCVYENETTIKIYVNGALEGTNSNCTNNSFKSDANDFLLGMFRGIDTSPCSIKQFMVFNNSLTDQEAIDLTTI